MKENDLKAGMKSSNIYPTSWPRDSKVVREEGTINLEALGEGVALGKAGFSHSKGVKKTFREEAEEKEISVMTDCGFQKAEGKVSAGRGGRRVGKDNVQSCMGLRVQRSRMA